MLLGIRFFRSFLPVIFRTFAFLFKVERFTLLKLSTTLLILLACKEPADQHSMTQSSVDTENTVKHLLKNMPNNAAFISFKETSESGSKMTIGFRNETYNDLDVAYSNTWEASLKNDCKNMVSADSNFLSYLTLYKQSLGVYASKPCRENIASKLGEAIFGVAKTAIKGFSEITHWIIMPDKPLANIPFASLRYNKAWLIENFTLAYIMSRVDGRLAWRQNPIGSEAENWKVLVVGSDAFKEYTPIDPEGVERGGIKNALKDYTELWGKDFTWSDFEKKIEQGNFASRNVIHFITHGVSANFGNDLIDSNDDKKGGLALGRLLKNLPNLRLIALNSCRTSDALKTGALSLASMIYSRSGVDTIGAYWSVGDTSASQFGGFFYNKLNQPGVTPIEALHYAQKSLLSSKRFSAPIDWAPYQYNGFGF